MSNNNNLILYAVIGLAAIYFLDKTFGQKEWTQTQTRNAITSAGGNVTSSPLGEFWQVPGGSVALNQPWTPNFAQRILVGVDKVVPGDWLTRKVFGI